MQVIYDEYHFYNCGSGIVGIPGVAGTAGGGVGTAFTCCSRLERTFASGSGVTGVVGAAGGEAGGVSTTGAGGGVGGTASTVTGGVSTTGAGGVGAITGVGVDTGADSTGLTGSTEKPRSLSNSSFVKPFKIAICPSSFSTFVTGVPAKLLDTASISVRNSRFVSRFFSSKVRVCDERYSFSCLEKGQSVIV